MIDYIVRYQYIIEGTNIIDDTILTIEDGYIEDKEMLEEILLEKLKEDVELEFDAKDIEIIEFEELVGNVNLYRFTDEDVYFE